jgi:hypothetical protein
MGHDVLTTIELDAPISEVWAVLEDVHSWEEWSRIFRFSRATVEPGGAGLLWARVGPAAIPLRVKFQVIDNESELRWTGGIGGVLHGSHFLKLEVIDENRTRLIHGETFDGVIISASWKLLAGQLPAAYKAFNKELRRKLAG